jgi:hypothetical protein
MTNWSLFLGQNVCRERRKTRAWGCQTYRENAQSILYRGARFGVVWPQFLAVAVIGGLFFGLALWRFRSVTAQAL